MTPLFLIKAIGYLIVVRVWVRVWVRKVIPRPNSRAKPPSDPGLQYALSVGTGYLIFLVGLTIGLQSLGLDLTSVAFLGGAIGIGIGVGLQPIVNNFVSGLILLVETTHQSGRPRLKSKSWRETLVKIAARSTWVRTNDQCRDHRAKLEKFTSQRVTNWTANDRSVRITLPVGTAYSSDPETVKRLLLQVAGEHPDVLREPAPDVIFAGFGDSSLDFELRVWTMSQVRTPQILQSDMYFSIFKLFKQEGIEIPFPQRDLHLRTVSMPIRLSPDRTAE